MTTAVGIRTLAGLGLLSAVPAALLAVPAPAAFAAADGARS